MLAQVNSQPGTVSGVVISPDGKTVKAIVVLTDLTRPISPRQVITRPDGSFAFDYVGPGEHSICVQVPATENTSDSDQFLDSCEWVSQAVRINLMAGQRLTGISVKANIGALVRVIVSDPLRLAATVSSNGAMHASSPDVVISVRGPDQLRRDLRALGSGGATHQFSLVVPYDTQLAMTARSRAFSVVDELGNDAAASERTFSVRKGTQSRFPSFTLRRR